jgi:hypothetical protein
MTNLCHVRDRDLSPVSRGKPVTLLEQLRALNYLALSALFLLRKGRTQHLIVLESHPPSLC